MHPVHGVQVPLTQVFPEGQAAHAAPFLPHSVLVGVVTQVPPLTHPEQPASVAAPHVPFVRLQVSPPVHAVQTVPPVPHLLAVSPE